MIHQHKDSSTVIPSLLGCLPYSLPLLRRLQDPQRSASSLILATFPQLSSSLFNGLFTAAYIDQSRRGESQAWFFCSLETRYQVLHDAGELDKVRTQMRDMFRYIRPRQSVEGILGTQFRGFGMGKDIIDEEGRLLCIASLSPLLVSVVQDIFPAADVRLSQVFIKYLFRGPPPSVQEREVLQGGLEFGELRSEDMDRVIATSSIRRIKETLLLLRNAAVFSVTGYKKVAIAWAFISLDGSLTTWWVEEEWRGKGLGKAVAKKVLNRMWEGGRQDGSEKGNVAWGHADVAVENWTSRRGLAGLGGVEDWVVRWIWVDLKAPGFENGSVRNDSN